MMKETNHTSVKFINADDGTEIPATNIKVVLPNNASFIIESQPGREGAAVFSIPTDVPEEQGVRIFSIEPGAGNLFSVNLVEFSRRP